ncbi:YceD family protein [Algihabitans albus]|uniref:YceD family protein n=1 Tax=Algihabitans albus TaxID=2164067 RepID=UPI000E5D78E6|nr:DUF177 domain-containing protein [Algihabitans albus]
MRKGSQGLAEGRLRGPDPEFSRPFALDKLGAQTALVEIEAKPLERAALAVRFDLKSLDRLSADLQVNRVGAGLVRVAGRLRSEGAQVCVVSLEPVPFALELPVSLSFATESQLQDAGEVLVDAEGDDPPEPIEHGAIDLGEAMAQTLAVALDPFPRAAEAVLNRSEFGPDGAPDAQQTDGAGAAASSNREISPFAVLEQLRPGRAGRGEGRKR